MTLNSKSTLQKRNELRAHYKATIDPATVPLYKDKPCKGCGSVKPCRWMTTFTQTGSPEYRSRCDDCWNARGRERVKANRTKMTSQKLDRSRRRKRECIEYLGGSCISCGYSKCSKALTFHHRVPEDKEFSISERVDAPWDVVKAELDKCVLLCFNCHMEEHCLLDHRARDEAGEPLKFSCNHTIRTEWE